MPVKCEQYNQVAVLALSGDFIGEETEETRRIIDKQIDEKRLVDFVIDFEKAGLIDSEGLETLLWIKRRCEDRFGQLRLAGLDENCQKILELTRLAPRFDCHPDLAAALKNIR
jgi:anti-anti-sigma factor